MLPSSSFLSIYTLIILWLSCFLFCSIKNFFFLFHRGILVDCIL
ncbi:putative membrane protein [Synechococcus sp. MVIR-18-1]|nr:putative membrane protein [Synechococcus sp. MVIR-18-1]